MSASILVVGGAGYIGSHMVKQLRRAGFAVAVADDLSSGRREAVQGAELHVATSATRRSRLRCCARSGPRR